MSGRILIVDPVATNRILMKVRLAGAFYDTILAACQSEALALARSIPPDLVLTSADLPDGSGIGLCRALRADPDLRGVPVVVLTGSRDTALRLRAFDAGADDVLSRPVDHVVLQARLRSLLRDRDTMPSLAGTEAGDQPGGMAEPAVPFQAPPHIALVSEDAAEAMRLRHALRAHLPSQIALVTRATALSGFAGATGPDVIVIRSGGPALTEALRLISELRARSATRRAALVLVVPAADRPVATLALDMGASDLIEAEAAPAEIALRLGKAAARKRDEDHRRDTVAAELRLASTDALTGLFNRRHALPQLARIAALASAQAQPFSVLLMDIDRFKSVNDTLGHGAGDRVLCEIADRLAGAMRPGDLLARIGGEEFLVALPDCGLDQARMIADRLRRLIAERPVSLPRGAGPLTVTLSVGLAEGGHGLTPDEIIDRADRALLACKAAGRNRVRAYLGAA